MSMHEAITRNLAYIPDMPKDPRLMVDRLREGAKVREKYELEVLQRGRDILVNSGAVGMVEEVRDIIAQSDPRLNPAMSNRFGEAYMPFRQPSDDPFDAFTLENDGTVSVTLGWDYQRNPDGRGVDFLAFTVRAFPLNGAVSVEGIGTTFFPESALQNSNQIPLANAIAIAYLQPRKQSSAFE